MLEKQQFSLVQKFASIQNTNTI